MASSSSVEDVELKSLEQGDESQFSRQQTKPRYRPNRSSIDENAPNSDLLTANTLTKQLAAFDSPKHVCGYAAYVLSARIRFAYFFVLLIIIGFVSISVFEFIVVFNVILPEAREEAGFATRAAVFLSVAPAVFVGGAMFIETLTQLVDDAYNNSMRYYRCHLVAFWHLLFNWKKINPVDRDEKYQEDFPGVSRLTLVIADFWVPIFLELMPVVGLILEGTQTRSFGGAIAGYFLYALRVTGALAIAYMFLRFLREVSTKYYVTVEYLDDISPKRLIEWDIPEVHAVDLDARVLNLGRALCTNKDCWKRQQERGDAPCCACCKCCFTESLYSKYTSKVNWYVRVAINTVGFVIVGLLASYGYLPTPVAYLGVCLALFGLGLLAEEKLPRMGGKAYKVVIIGFTVLGIALFGFAFSNLSLKGNYNIRPPPINAGALPPNTGLSRGAYSTCKLQWLGLNMVDLALISNAAYATNNAGFRSVMTNIFTNTSMSNFTVVYQSDEDDIVSFHHVHFPTTNLDVVSVRGTSSVTEVYLDLYLYFGIGLLQTSSKIVPVTGVLPQGIIKRILYLLSLPGFAVEGPRRHVLDYVENLVISNNNVLVTGHSLGGSLAGAAGAQSKTPAVTFSPPGLYFVNQKLGITDDQLRTYVTVVVPDNDVVPLVDSQLGAVQYVKCDGGAARCHSLDSTICLLKTVCGDPRGRDYSIVCDGEKKTDNTFTT